MGRTRTICLLAAVGLGAVLLALAAGFAPRSGAVTVETPFFTFTCPAALSVQTREADGHAQATFWAGNTQVGGVDYHPAPPWQALAQAEATLLPSLVAGEVPPDSALFAPCLLECSALGQPVQLREAGGRTHTLYFPASGGCYDLWLDPGGPCQRDLAVVRASFALL